MKKSDLLMAIGQEPNAGDAEAEPDEGSPDEEASDAEEDQAIDDALDASNDPDARRAAFRRAVELCSKSGY